MWSRFGLVSFFSLPLPLVCSAGTEQLPACLSGVLSHQSSDPDTHTRSRSVLFRDGYNADFKKKKVMDFSTLDGAGEQIQCLFLAGWRSWTLHSFQMKSLYHAMCWDSHLHTDSRFTNFLPCPCLHLSRSADLDLDYDSYHEDYYDRYCHTAAHTHLIACLRVTVGSRGFIIIAVAGCLCFLGGAGGYVAARCTVCYNCQSSLLLNSRAWCLRIHFSHWVSYPSRRHLTFATQLSIYKTRFHVALFSSPVFQH